MNDDLAEPDWKIDLHTYIADALEKLMPYLGVQFEDGRLREIAGVAAITAVDQILSDVQAGKTREVSSMGSRPDFCFWTASRDDDETAA